MSYSCISAGQCLRFVFKIFISEKMIKAIKTEKVNKSIAVLFARFGFVLDEYSLQQITKHHVNLRLSAPFDMFCAAVS